ncbi:MAG: hypothetical protein J7639_10110 [Paenibacillaceae bacterium]|uniref:Flp1 family type IVb pilin n=1 Tax=Paenibacillus cymbidii TaxID=1639034 RepID=UPI0010801E10|nr:Flp1 family type IVb pilin [Paenibacillus cymbidii]MBO9606296.1 hypothetical protein [Paenibacillaceae bacterium]
METSNRALRRIRQGWRRFWRDEQGIGTLELLLILAVIVVIAIAFRKWIFKWVNALFNSANAQIESQTSVDGNVIAPSPTP